LISAFRPAGFNVSCWNLGWFQTHWLKYSLQVKVKVKVKFSLEQAMKAQRGSRGIALLFL
jgi:uncharacterized membrane protein